MSVWQHIEKSDEFQALDEAGKTGLRRDYFTDFIVKDPDFGKLPEVERHKVYLEFVNQGQQPLEQPIYDEGFRGIMEKMAEASRAAETAIPTLEGAPQMPGPTPPEMAQIAGEPFKPAMPLAQAHEPPQIPYPDTLAPAHKPPLPDPLAGKLPQVDIPESLDPVLTMDPNAIRPYEPKASSDLLRDILKLLPVLPSGLGYGAGFIKGPEPGAVEMPTLEQRHEKGAEYAAKITEPFEKLERAIAPKDEITGELEPTGIDVAFDLLMKAGDSAGAKVLKETGNPYLATAAATTIQAAPILLPLVGRRMPGLVNRIKTSKTFEALRPEQKAKIFETLEETLRANPNMTEAEIIRQNPQFFREAVERRGAKLTPEEPRLLEGPKPEKPIEPIGETIKPEPRAPEKPAFVLETIEKPTPEAVKAPVASQALKPEVPGEAAAPKEPPVQVSPFPEQEPALPAPSKPAEPEKEIELPKELENILPRVTYEGGKFLESDVVSMPLKDKTKIDQWLIDTKHPLASEPGTQKDRIIAIAREMDTKRKAEAKAQLQKEAEIAKRKSEAEAKAIAEYKHVEGIEVPVKGIREKTGDKITVRMDAKKALEKIDSDIEILNKIVECL